MIFHINRADYEGVTWGTLKEQVFNKQISNQVKEAFVEKWSEAGYPDQALSVLREGILYPVYWWFHHYVWAKSWFYSGGYDWIKVHVYLEFLDSLEGEDLDYLWGFSWANNIVLNAHEKMYLLS